MGGLKKDLPITYWTFLIGAIAIAGVPGLAGFFSKDEILAQTFFSGHRVLWVIGVLTALLTAAYMFRLVFLAFHGQRRYDLAPAHGHAPAHVPGDAHAAGGHLHDAPPAMALALIVLAIGSVVAGYVGVPAALGGSNRIEHFLEPSFTAERPSTSPPGERSEPGLPAAQSAAAPLAERSEASSLGELSEPAHSEATEFALMGVSIAVAFIGIGIAWYFFVSRPSAADAVAASAAPVHRLLLHKYYIDELYDAAIVQPVVTFSRGTLWKIVDAELIDGAVNGAGAFVNARATLLRRLQTGSVRVYAASLTLGVVLVLGYYAWRIAQVGSF